MMFCVLFCRFRSSRWLLCACALAVLQACGKHADEAARPAGPPEVEFAVAQRSDAPLVTGGIRSDIHVGGDKDQGKVDLGIFNAGAGKSAKVVLWSGAGVLLEQVRHDPDFLRVRLVKQDKDADKRTKWQLEVTVPPDALYGSFPEKSAVYLRLNSTPPRLIRIPVVGTASGR